MRAEGLTAALWPPYLATLLGGLVMVAPGLQFVLGIPTEPLDVMHRFPTEAVDMLAAGALSAWPVIAAEPDRLLTYALLHAGPAHAFVNGGFLAVFGATLETALGARRLLVVVVAGALAGGIAAACLPSAFVVSASVVVFPVIVGSSAAVWAVVGGVVIALWARPDSFSEGVQRSRKFVSGGVFLGLASEPVLFAIGLLPIAWTGHLAGFLCGAAVVGWMVRRGPSAAPQGAGLTAAAATSVLLVCLAIAMGAQRALAHGREAGLDAVLRLVTHAALPTPIRNTAAEVLARDPAPGRARLAAARDSLLARAEPGLGPEATSALAEIHHRLGDLEAAIELGRERLAELGSSDAATDLARYLAARATTGTGAPGTVAIRFLPAADSASEVEVRWATPPRSGAELFAGVVRGERIVGLLRFETGPSAAAWQRFEVHDTNPTSGLRGARAEVWWLREESPQALETGAVRWRLWPVRDEISTLSRPREQP